MHSPHSPVLSLVPYILNDSNLNMKIQIIGQD